MPLILVVEDELELAAVTEKYLQHAGFDTQILDNGQSVVDWVAKNQPDVILLDLMLPGMDGLEVCRELVKATDIPIIITTAKVDELDRLIGLEAGADDYVCKPYSPREVVARVKVCLRRSRDLGASNDTLRIDEERLTVILGERVATLTLIEFNLFRLLYNNPRRIFSRQHIIDRIYHDYRIVSEQTVNSHIRNLRKKLVVISPTHDLVYSIYGVGYRYAPVLRKTTQ
jgi:two-component system response regulator BaeR